MSSNKKNAKDDLLENHEFLGTVIDNVLDSVIVIDEKARIRHFNDIVADLLGYSAEEVIGKNIKCLMPESFAVEHDQYVKNYLDTGERKIIGIGREVIARRKDGEEFPVELFIKEMHCQGTRYFVGAIRDITDRLARENELKIQKERMDELSTPILTVWEQVVLVPLIGVIDSNRAALLIENLLKAITDLNARVAVIDVTGVPEIDTYVADQLVKTVSAAEMLGASVLVTGIRPEVAQALVRLGVDLTNMNACGPLKLGIRKAMALVAGQKELSGFSQYAEERTNGEMTNV